MRTLTERLQYLNESYLSQFVQDYTPGAFDALFECEDEHLHSPALMQLRTDYLAARARGDQFACACIAFASVLVNVGEVGE